MKEKTEQDFLNKFHLGQTIYYVPSYFFYSKTKREVIKIKSLEIVNYVKENIKIRINNEYSLSEQYLNRCFFFSEKKARNVEKNLKGQKERYDKRIEAREKQEIENTSKNDELLETYTHLKKGDSILIKIEKGEWVKTKVADGLRSSKKIGVFKFQDNLRLNILLTSREGKNWIKWTELDELKSQKELLDKKQEELLQRIKRIEEKEK
jgi:hypothetical protein